MNRLRSTVARLAIGLVEDEELAQKDQVLSTLEQRDLNRRTKLTNLITIGQAVGATGFVLFFLGLRWSDADFPLLPLFSALLALLCCAPAFWLARSRYITLAGYVLVTGAVIAVASVYLVIGGFDGPTTIVFLWPIMVAAMLVDLRASFVTASITTLFHGIMAFLALDGRFTPQMTSSAPSVKVTFVASGICMFFLMAFLSWLSTRDLKTALQKAQQRAIELDTQFKENKWLVEQLRNTSGQLAPTAEELASTMEQLQATAEGIVATTNEMVRGAAAQASQVEVVSKSIEQMAALIREIAASAETVDAASVQARERVNESARALRMLNERAQEIGRMVVIVDKFADQTNLLALNAAIEAARAGEYGKGFAVVADEVRSLSESSSKSVREIAELSKGIQREIDGVLRSMDEVVKAVEETADLAQGISKATSQQRESSEKIVRSVNELATVAEENASGSEETAAAIEEQTTSMEQITGAAQELADMASKLGEAVLKFSANQPFDGGER